MKPHIGICLIDDDEDDIELMRLHCQNIPDWDTTLVGLSHIPSDFTSFHNHAFDILFVDYQLGPKTGLEILQDMHHAGLEQPIIFLTGMGNEHTAVEVMKAGAADYIPKSALSPQVLKRAIHNALEKHRLNKSLHLQQSQIEETQRQLLHQMEVEKELLEHTLKGTIEAMAQVLSLLNPEAFGRSIRIRRYVTIIAKNLELKDTWKLEISALLSQLGWVTLPQEILQKLSGGKRLTDEETDIYQQYPRIGAELLSKIPRMEEIAEIIRYQDYPLDPFQWPEKPSDLKVLPQGSRFLKVALDLDVLECSGHSKTQALEELMIRKGQYDPRILGALQSISLSLQHYRCIETTLNDLNTSMTLSEGVFSQSGLMILPPGQPVTLLVQHRLQNFSLYQQIREPISVYIPISTIQEELKLSEDSIKPIRTPEPHQPK
ncbi:MAG: response regulator [Nitrospirae bacterium]|nr:response regulator [Nitrospirota bacterium]